MNSFPTPSARITRLASLAAPGYTLKTAAKCLFAKPALAGQLLGALLLALPWSAIQAVISPEDQHTETSNTACAPPCHQVSLNADGVVLDLRLSANSLLGQTLIVVDDEKHLQTPLALQGQVLGDPQSWARLTLDTDGIYLGQIKAFGKLYTVDTDSSGKQNIVSSLPSYAEQYRALELGGRLNFSSSPPQPALIDYLLPAPPAKTADTTGYTGSPRNAIADLRATYGVAVPKSLRIGIVVDSRFNEHHRGRGLSRALALVNVIDGIYQQELGAALLLDTLVAYTDPMTDPLRDVNGTVEDMLETFRRIRQFESNLRSDLTMVHLFTGLRDPGGVLGLGWIDTACRTDGFDVSLSTPFTYDALLAAHEMAHNLGAQHDDSPSCQTDRSRIMWPRLSSLTEPSFSACSLQALAPALEASCNLDNVDLSLGLQSRQGDNEVGRRLSVVVRNNDPNRSARDVQTLYWLPIGSEIDTLPSSCRRSALGGENATLTCLHGTLPALSNQRVELEIRLESSPREQWLRVETGSTVSSDTTSYNNRAQLNLRQLGTSANNRGNNDSLPQSVNPTQLILADGTLVTLGQSGSNLINPSGDSAGIGASLWPLWLAPALLVALARRRRQIAIP